MPIPPKYVYEGDEEKARAFRGFAQSQLEILRNDMGFQGLKQDKRTVNFSDGTIIECKINHGLEQATIYCPPVIVEEEEEKVVEITSYIESPGGVLKQGATIGAIPGIKSCNKQGAVAPIETCEGAVLPFQEPIIAGNIQVRGGVPPYTWKITGEDYYFKDEDGNNVYESGGELQPPMCVGGIYHGWLGGLQGVTGMLYILLGGGIINKDICERGGGYYLYRGLIEFFFTVQCGGTLFVEDICGNKASVELEATPIEWDYELSADTITKNSSAEVWVRGGSRDYTWTITGDGYWLDAGHTLKEIVTTGMNVTVYADNTIASPATISIVDACGSMTEGSITCEGSWVYQGQYGVTWGGSLCRQPCNLGGRDETVDIRRWVSQGITGVCQRGGTVDWNGLPEEDQPGTPIEWGLGSCDCGGVGFHYFGVTAFYKWVCT